MKLVGQPVKVPDKALLTVPPVAAVTLKVPDILPAVALPEAATPTVQDAPPTKVLLVQVSVQPVFVKFVGTVTVMALLAIWPEFVIVMFWQVPFVGWVAFRPLTVAGLITSKAGFNPYLKPINQLVPVLTNDIVVNCVCKTALDCPSIVCEEVVFTVTGDVPVDFTAT